LKLAGGSSSDNEKTGSIDPAARCWRKIGLKNLNVKSILRLRSPRLRGYRLTPHA
jgi:hypothetical protein